MSKEKQLYEILRTLQKGEIGTDLAHLQILRLFSVVGRSQHLDCVDCDYVRVNDNCIECRKCGDVKDVAI